MHAIFSGHALGLKKSFRLGIGPVSGEHAVGALGLCSVQEVFDGDDRHVDVAEDGRGEDDELVIAAEAGMRVDVIVGAGIVGAFGVVGDHQAAAGVAIEEMDGRGAAAEEAFGRIADQQAAISAAV